MSWLAKRLALRGYRKRLGLALGERYGREPSYTVAQVRATIEALGLAKDYELYAFAAYCSRDAFGFVGNRAEWQRMRAEVRPRYLPAEADRFSPNDGSNLPPGMFGYRP